jgi:hypothetical protein
MTWAILLIDKITVERQQFAAVGRQRRGLAASVGGKTL